MGLNCSRSGGLLLVALLLLGCQALLIGKARSADRVELSGLQSQFAPTITDKPPEELGKAIGFAAGLEQGSELSFQRKTSSSSNIDHLHYEQLYKGVPVWGERITISRNKSNEIVRYSGAIMRGLSFDVPDNKAAVTPQAALERAKSVVSQGANFAPSQLKSENDNVRLVVYVRPSDKKAFLSYEVSFFAVPAAKAAKPSRPFLIIDAKTGDVLYRYEGLTNEKGTGPGGNERTGKYFYGKGKLPALDVESTGAKCRMSTKDIATINFNNQVAAPETPFEFKCSENTYHETNGGYAPLNDAHYFATIAVKMYRDWYGTSPLEGKVLLRVHYGENYENAFWNGQCLTFGDGADSYYPLVSLDIMAHELSHGFTEQHSNLIYAGESGAMNEAFSDMAAEAAKSYAANGKQTDFRIGTSIMKGTEDKSLRYLCDPRRDGQSIDNVSDYKPELDVHLASGVYNKAFCQLAKTAGWDVRKTFGVFLAANRDYWAPNSTFVSGARDVVHAAQDAGYPVEDVKAAFKSVGIVLDASATPTPAPKAIEPQVSSLKSAKPQASLKASEAKPASAQQAAIKEAAPVKEAHEQSGIVGDWAMPDSGDVLTIKDGGRWFHPKHGLARIREGNDAADLKIYYANANAQCSYRISFGEQGKTLTLTAADPTQDPDFCPAGTLRSVGRNQ